MSNVNKYKFQVTQEVIHAKGRGMIRFQSIPRCSTVPMYDVELADGHRLDAWESELSEVR